jgi:hypothetical protein
MTTQQTSSTLADREPMTGSMDQQHPLAGAGEDVGESAGRIAQRAADVGFTQADRGVNQAADKLEGLAGSIRQVAADMELDQPQMANVAQTAADQTEHIARYLRETDARQLIDNVENAARKQPLLFLGGAFLIGMAASRFLKAAGPKSDGSTRGHGPMRNGYRSGFGSGDTVGGI